MCRFAAYLGHPLRLSQLITEPVHSLINQSHHARERQEPLNGDGFGVAWFVPEAGPCPALFKDITPAWNNENLLELARVTQSRCILAHVRAASPSSPVQRLNCHPFAHERYAFMHNGHLAGFSRWRRKLLSELSDDAFLALRGSTDSEHAFALFLDQLREAPDALSLEAMANALQRTIERLEVLRVEAGVHESSAFNFVVSDGEGMVATRYSSHPSLQPASLHYTTGKTLRCENGRIRLDQDRQGERDPDVVMIVSEETGADFCWSVVPPGTMLLARHPGEVTLRPLAVATPHDSDDSTKEIL